MWDLLFTFNLFFMIGYQYGSSSPMHYNNSPESVNFQAFLLNNHYMLDIVLDPSSITPRDKNVVCLGGPYLSKRPGFPCCSSWLYFDCSCGCGRQSKRGQTHLSQEVHGREHPGCLSTFPLQGSPTCGRLIGRERIQ